MKLLIAFFIFSLVLFIYLHVHHQLKLSNDLEVLEIDMPSKDKLEEVCDIRQPIIISPSLQSDGLMETCTKSYIHQNYGSFDLLVHSIKSDIDHKNTPVIPLTANETIDLFNKDIEGVYFTEGNQAFLTETGMKKKFQYNDSLFRPYMVSSCKYDIMFASTNTVTPLRYLLNYRNYFYVTEGAITVKIIPPKYTKYLYPTKDYETL